MKLAFIFMFFLNLVFFGWQSIQSDNPAPTPNSSDKNKSLYNTITLLHETEGISISDNSTNITVTSKSTTDKEQSISTRIDEAKSEVDKLTKNEITNCFKLGPYSVKLNAEQSLARAKSHGALANIYSEERRERFRYWVLVPTTDKQAALEEIQKFKEKGIEDVFLIREGKKKNDISLGIFRARTTAQQRIQDLQDHGFNPIVEKHYKIKNEFWLSIKETIRSPLTRSAWLDIIGGFASIKETKDTC